MGKTTAILIIAFASLISADAYAAASVPEIDATGSMLGMGLVAGIVALVREYRRRK